jgi:transaldolase
MNASNPLLVLREHGQSVWLDFIRRTFVTGGDLGRLVQDDGLAGVTSNPTILEKAIAATDDYAGPIAELIAGGTTSPRAIYERLAVGDVQAAADVLRPVYDRTGGGDGFSSLEVSPGVAHDTEATVAEARSLWTALARPNVMVKVPGTPAGVPAVRALVAEGINVNITLLFSRQMYRAVAEAYLDGLELLAARGAPLERVASVASFFVSRIDTVVDGLLAQKYGGDSEEARRSRQGLEGKVAIANAKLAYQDYKELFEGTRFQALARRGARVQRLLWASTGTKNPRYRDVLYVEELIGPTTVSTMPPETLAAFRDHGRVRDSLEEDVEGARTTLANLERAGISLSKVTDGLIADGIEKFARPFASLLQMIAERAQKAQR